MAKESSTGGHRNAVDRVRQAESFAVDLPLVGHMRIPRPERLAYYGALAALAAAEIIEWPIALVLGVGHALAENHQSKFAQELGEALEEV
ncbi:MAG: hypothetical protein NVS4B6_24730 [Mycobacterium sp.]